MAVRRHKEVDTLDDAAFEAWREQKMKDLIHAVPRQARHGRRRYAQDVMRKYVKRRRARVEGPES